MLIDQLIEYANTKAVSKKIADVRAGVGYTCVMLDDNACGLAYTFRDELGHCCSILSDAGKLIGRDAAEISTWAKDNNRLKAAIGLATINAVLNNSFDNCGTGNVLDALQISADDTFGMVGLFSPILAEVRKKTDKTYVFEKNAAKGSGLYTEDDIPIYLPKCDVIIITATSIINHTIDDLLAYCSNARQVCIVGPSTPLCPEIFQKYNVSLLAGSVVQKPELALQIISQGGGTMSLKPIIKQVLLRL